MSSPHKGIVPAAIGLVEIVRQHIVFKAVDPVVVVEIDAEEKLRTVHRESQKRFFVIGQAIGYGGVVVLIEIGDEVVVFIPAGKDNIIAD